MIRILESDSNRRGDLFGRLMADLFVALGYDNPRLNIHKSGREVDLQANHRLERRLAVGECKATDSKVGGADINKFVGIVDAEHKPDKPAIGYFISLTGFTETAIEQECNRKRTEIVLLDASGVVAEMVKGNVLINRIRAAEISGRLCSKFSELVLDDSAELLAHIRGWVWAVYYGTGKDRTHFVLIHADGTPLLKTVADEIVSADQSVGGELYKLACINPLPIILADRLQATELARAAYSKTLADECGTILLDGMPADSDVGTRQLRLENLFVPLHLDEQTVRTNRDERLPVGTALLSNPRLAILAAPGAGKSTLLKRLAVAYSDNTRRKLLDDSLPEKEWLPILIRCRELRTLARGSFAEILESLANREGVRAHAATFRTLVDEAFLEGKALLLVDGLDEISHPGDRAAFVSTLRSAVQAYPSTTLVVTSREAGFRHVAAHLAPICKQVTLSSFDASDIERLCVAWHREVVADTEKVRTDAVSLAQSILENNRIRLLAVNPLMLTTIMLVKRWLGSLPSGRAALYGKAVELLLNTWNTEGYDPLLLDEALPQLCYVASAMMRDGIQKISHRRLAKLLLESRSALPTELGYVSGTVDEFIRRVEYRSSLLILSGQDVEDGVLSDFYEFRHLTFQEYLTARGLVEGWHPDRKDDDTLTTVLEPHFHDEKWREVIPLAAVLGRKETDGLIKQMTTLLNEIKLTKPKTKYSDSLQLALGQSLADEAAAKPDTIRTAIQSIVINHGRNDVRQYCSQLARGKYGKVIREECKIAIQSQIGNIPDVMTVLAEVVFQQSRAIDLNHIYDAIQEFNSSLCSSNSLNRIEAALGLMVVAFNLRDRIMPDARLKIQFLSEGVQHLSAMLIADSEAENYAAAWALAWYGEKQICNKPEEFELHTRLFQLMRNSNDQECSRMVSWAFVALPLFTTDCAPYISEEHQLSEWCTVEKFNAMQTTEERIAMVVIGWYCQKPWSNDELAKLLITAVRTSKVSRFENATVRRLATILGLDPEKDLFPDMLDQVRIEVEMESDNSIV